MLEKLNEFYEKTLTMTNKGEETIKTALVLPFLAALGYDVFNPTEVRPELRSDIGLKKGEKVDYGIYLGDDLRFIIECKALRTPLEGDAVLTQLYRYFTVSKTRLAILTDGLTYKFYSDTITSNVMDLEPLFEFSLDEKTPPLTSHHEDVITFLSKENFNIEKFIGAALEYKTYLHACQFISHELCDPSADFIRFIARNLTQEKLTTTVLKRLAPSIIRAAHSFDFLPLQDDEAIYGYWAWSKGEKKSKLIQPEEKFTNGIITTEEEIEAHKIICELLAPVLTPDRITLRDAKTYCAILLDDNNRKPICRLWFNSQQKYLGLFRADKTEVKFAIDKLEDICEYSEQLLNIVNWYFES